MKKKTIIISGIATVLVIGSVVFCFAVKGDGTQPTEVAQTVTEAVSTPTIEIPEEEPEVVEEVPEVEEVEVPEEEPEVVEETPEEEPETSWEVSIVEVAETTEEDEGAGVSTPEVEETEPTQPEKTEQTEQVEQAKTNPKVNQITTDQAVADALAKLDALGAEDGIPSSTSTLGDYVPSADVAAAASQIIVE